MIATGTSTSGHNTISSTTLFRLSGLALLIALPILIVGFFLHPSSEAVASVLRPTYAPAHLVLGVSWIFAVLGLPGFYALQAHRAGKLGLVGFVLTIAFAAYHFYLLLYEATVPPLLARDPALQSLIGDGPLAHGAGALGPLSIALMLAWPLFGVATLRARILPRWAGWLQILTVPVMALNILFFSLPTEVIEAWPGGLQPIALVYYTLFLGYAWGGYTLWRGKQPLREPAPEAAVIQPAA